MAVLETTDMTRARAAARACGAKKTCFETAAQHVLTQATWNSVVKASALLEVLLDLFNCVFSTGAVPSTWRTTLFRMLAKMPKVKLCLIIVILRICVCCAKCSPI